MGKLSTPSLNLKFNGSAEEKIYNQSDCILFMMINRATIFKTLDGINFNDVILIENLYLEKFTVEPVVTGRNHASVGFFSHVVILTNFPYTEASAEVLKI